MKAQVAVCAADTGVHAFFHFQFDSASANAEPLQDVEEHDKVAAGI